MIIKILLKYSTWFDTFSFSCFGNVYNYDINGLKHLDLGYHDISEILKSKEIERIELEKEVEIIFDILLGNIKYDELRISKINGSGGGFGIAEDHKGYIEIFGKFRGLKIKQVYSIENLEMYTDRDLVYNMVSMHTNIYKTLADMRMTELQREE